MRFGCVERKAEGVGGDGVAELAEAEADGDGEEVTAGTCEDARDCISKCVWRRIRREMARSWEIFECQLKFSASCNFYRKLRSSRPKAGLGPRA